MESTGIQSVSSCSIRLRATQISDLVRRFWPPARADRWPPKKAPWPQENLSGTCCRGQSSWPSPLSFPPGPELSARLRPRLRLTRDRRCRRKMCRRCRAGREFPCQKAFRLGLARAESLLEFERRNSVLRVDPEFPRTPSLFAVARHYRSRGESANFPDELRVWAALPAMPKRKVPSSLGRDG